MLLLLLVGDIIIVGLVHNSQWAKSPKKQSVEVNPRLTPRPDDDEKCILSTWYCILSVNALLQTVFLAILPTGLDHN